MITFIRAAMQMRVWSSYADNLATGNAEDRHNAALFAWSLMGDFQSAFEGVYR